jgi:single-stranded DNA-binding protein
MAFNNTVFITGNLGSDPTFTPAADGKKARVNLFLISNEGSGDNETSIRFSVTNWFSAVNASKTLKKGDRVTIEGYLTQFDRVLKDDEGNEVKVPVTSIVADKVSVDLAFATAEITRSSGNGGGNGSARPTAAAASNDEEAF